MFKFEKEDIKLVEGLVDGTKTKKANQWIFIYNLLKFIGIIGTGVALVNFGITVQFGVIAGSIFTSLLGIHQTKVSTAKKEKAEEDLAKQNFMLKIQSNIADSDFAIDGKTFKLERTAGIDYRKPVYFKEIKVTEDGEQIEEEKQYAMAGNEEVFVRATDDRNGYICWLKLVKKSIVEQHKLSSSEGYVSRIVPKYSIGMLEDYEVEKLPEEVKIQTASYDGSDINEIVGNVRTKKRN